MLPHDLLLLLQTRPRDSRSARPKPNQFEVIRLIRFTNNLNLTRDMEGGTDDTDRIEGTYV